MRRRFSANGANAASHSRVARACAIASFARFRGVVTKARFRIWARVANSGLDQTPLPDVGIHGLQTVVVTKARPQIWEFTGCNSPGKLARRTGHKAGADLA
jgi:hypothetical protein